MIRLEIVESPNRERFVKAVEDFCEHHWVIFDSLKFQRNLFYAGIGSSAGHTPGSTQDLSKARLDESWVAFILWRSDVPTEDTRSRD
jgi:hypothetical protein